MALSADQKSDLLLLARERLEEKLRGNLTPVWDRLKHDPGYTEKNGLFVTLKKDDDLRGCIGTIIGDRTVPEGIRSMAVQAAFYDPRFPPVEADELNDITIEISILTVPAPVDSWRDIVIGRDGMILSMRGRQALFLPQVAPEQGWDLETTLSYLSRKAGLPTDAWRDPACRFQTFQAEVFGEHESV
jgi:AmmeMemoRadiSam system protein A